MNRSAITNYLIVVVITCWIIARLVGPFFKAAGKLPPSWTDDLANFKEIGDTILLLGVLTKFVPFLNRIKQLSAERAPSLTWDTSLPQHTPLPENMRQKVWDQSWKLWKERIKRIIDSSFIVDADGQPIELTYVRYRNFQYFRDNQPNENSGEAPIVGSNASMAIVGPAGIGKSYTLLRLLQQTMEVVGEDIEHYQGRVPVLLDLATWDQYITPAIEHKFELWAHRTLCSSYKLKPSIAQWLINRHELLFFLDGLDEVAPERRGECFTAILQYSANTGNALFSCRPHHLLELLQQAAEIDDWPARFPIYAIQPVTEYTVTAVIQANMPDKMLAAQAVAALANYELYRYVETPLLLNLYVQVFKLFSAEALTRSAAQGHTGFANLLWREYEKLRNIEYGSQHPTTWTALRTTLIWTARKIHPSNTFFIEDIQPHHWLHDTPPLLLRNYSQLNSHSFPRSATSLSAPLLLYYFTSRLLTALLLAVAVGLVIAGPWDFLAEGVIVSIFATLLTVGIGYSPWVKAAVDRIETALARFVPKNLTLAVFFSFWLMVCCALYEGLTVKRTALDMKFGYFSVTQATLGVIMGLIAGIVFGFRKYDQKATDDIRPLERVGFKWKEALSTGLRGGIVVGILIGLIGVFLHFFLPGATLDDWLRDYFGASHDSTLSTRGWQAIQVFLLAFLVASPIGFVLLGLLASLDTNHSLLEVEEKKRINRFNAGISRSLRNGLVNAFWVLGVISLMYLVVYAYHREFQPERLQRILLAGTGASLIAFLWFGGFEVLQHWTLRFYLFIYGRLPLNFHKQLRTAQRLAYFEQAGYLISFTHLSLLEYYHASEGDTYAPPPPADLSRPWFLRFIVLTLLFGGGYLLFIPLVRRYPETTSQFWHHPNEFAITILPKFGHLLPIAQSNGVTVIKMRKAGLLQVRYRGTIKLGTFIGYSGAEGVEYGFMGFKIKNVYDSHPQFAHGAVLYQQSKDTTWYALANNAIRNPLRRGTPETVVLHHPVKPGDEIHFVVNDREWENNIGQFQLECYLKPNVLSH